MRDISPDDAITVIEFLMSKLPEEELAELDKLLDTKSGEPATGMDAALQKRLEWVSIGARGRNAHRAGRRTAHAQDAASTREFEQRFPHARRLKF